jgi:hypothetical protein
MVGYWIPGYLTVVLWPALLQDEVSEILESSSESISSTPLETAAAATASGAAEAGIKSMALGMGRRTVPKIPAIAFVLDAQICAEEGGRGVSTGAGVNTHTTRNSFCSRRLSVAQHCEDIMMWWQSVYLSICLSVWQKIAKKG